jgi:hypothetical protein
MNVKIISDMGNPYMSCRTIVGRVLLLMKGTPHWKGISRYQLFLYELDRFIPGSSRQVISYL